MDSVYSLKNMCSGCNACSEICASGAITMEPDREGFLYPNIDQEKCTDCKLCQKVCPFEYDTGLKAKDMPKFYVAKHNDIQVLEKSTSGGVFTALSDIILNLNGVVYGADFDNDYKIFHSRAENTNQRDRQRISKYAQSDITGVFGLVKKDLQNNKEVLFTGTPCQCAGLKSYLLTRKCNTKKLYICDLICHSIPSPLIWREYKQLLEKEKGKKLAEVYFRTKQVPWSRANSNKGFIYRYNEETTYYTDDRFYQLFFGEMAIMRPSCENCPFTDIYRVSDITIADYWGIEEIAPHWYDEKGVSVAITNTEKGDMLLQSCKDTLKFEQRDRQEQITQQKRLSQPPVYPKTREKFWQKYYQNGFEYISDMLKEKYK